MRFAAVVVLAAAAPAAAAPCSVDLVRSPDDVRAIVETWVGAEPRCSTALEVRIVPSDGGLFVIARDDRGRIHDRTVPDAQTAGVLIASWAADDDVALPRSPSAVATTLVVPRPAQHGDERHWIRLGSFLPVATAMFANNDQIVYPDTTATGMHGSVGVWSRGAWTIDVTVGFEGSAPAPGYRRPGDGRLTMFYGDLIPTAGYVLRLDRFSLTPSLGLGARYTTMDYGIDLPDRGLYWKRAVMSWVGQLGVVAAYDILPRLQVTAGPIVTVFPDPWMINQNAELVVFGGVGWAM